MTAPQEVLARRLRTQARACAELGSPLYAELMVRAAADVEARGPVFDVLAGHENVRLTLWPGGRERVLATAGFHGQPVRWLS